MIGTLPLVTEELQVEPLRELDMVTVVNPSHGLANRRGPISEAAIKKRVQLVLSDRTALSQGRDFGVFSLLMCRLADRGPSTPF